MLVLSRKVGEIIEIDDGRILLMVIKIDGDKVRLWIAAPKEISVHRKEVADKMRKKIADKMWAAEPICIGSVEGGD